MELRRQDKVSNVRFYPSLKAGNEKGENYGFGFVERLTTAQFALACVASSVHANVGAG